MTANCGALLAEQYQCQALLDSPASAAWDSLHESHILMWHVSAKKEFPLRGVALIHVVLFSLYCLVNTWMEDRLNVFDLSLSHDCNGVMPR